MGDGALQFRPGASFFRRNRFTVAFWGTLAIFAFGGFLAGCFQDIEDLVDDISYYFCGFYYFDDALPGEASNLAPLSFEVNLGQTDSRYSFVAQGRRHTISLSATEATFDLLEKRAPNRTVRVRIEGGRAAVQPRATEALSGRVNYFTGNDPKKWITDIPTFARVTFPEVYPGIDVAYHGAGGYVENDFIVAPGADSTVIKLSFDGADGLSLDSDGSLAISAGDRTLRWKKPVIYQQADAGKRRAIEGRFRIGAGNTIGFELGVYDRSRPLVIDPVITYSTYFGTANTDGASRVVADASGNAYIIGGTNASSFPVTVGTVFSSVGTSLTGDVMLAKLSADGRKMIYTTHLGGASSELGLGIALDSSGSVYLSGFTYSADFPHTVDLTTHNILTNMNCFVTKLSPSGNAMVYSTLIGGSGADGCGGIAVDNSGNAIVVGATSSTDFPTVSAIQTSLKKGFASAYAANAIIAKLSPDGTKLLYSTYLGGSGGDFATAVAADAAGNAYVTGFTNSLDFPISSSGVFQPAFGGAGGQSNSLYSSGDAFVVKMSPSGSLVYSTYLGGSQDDLGSSIAVDSQGNAYVAGATLSKNFPTRQAFQTVYGGAGGDGRFFGGDGFVAELNPSGTGLLFSSFIGGALDDRVASLALDNSGNIWLAGHSMSHDFPVSADASQKTNAGDDGSHQASYLVGDAFLTQIGPDHKIAFSTLLGGSSADWAGGVAVDGQGGVIIAGGTASTDFPVSQGTYQPKYGGIDLLFPVGDAFIARFGGAVSGVSIAGVASAASYVGGTVAPGEVILIAGTSIGPTNLAGAQLDASGKLSTLVAGTQFLFNGVPAPIVYVGSQYSSVIVPYEVAQSPTAQIVAVYNGVNSPPLTLPVVPAVPGIFSADASGRGLGAILNASGVFNSAQFPADRGTVVALFATGEGQTIPAGVTGQVTTAVVKPALPVSVTFGGVPATNFKYIGEAPGEAAGLLQINVEIPAAVPSGNVPVVLTVGTAASQTGLTIMIR